MRIVNVKNEEKVLKIDRPMAGGFLSLTRLWREGCGGGSAAVFEKRGAPYGAGWARLTVAGCVKRLHSLTLKGKVAAPPQYLAPYSPLPQEGGGP